MRNFGGCNKNNLNSIIQANFTDNNEDNSVSDVFKISSYYSIDQTAEIYTAHKYSLCLLSLNCQSINAKFDTLILLIESLKQNNLEFSIICLQETWLEEGADLSLFQIPGYDCVAKGKYCSAHGGLITYVHVTARYL